MRTIRLAMTRLLITAGALALGLGPHATESEPSLILRWTAGSRSYTRSELLRRPDITRIQVAHDPAYDDKPRTYKAVPFHALWKDIPLPGDALLQFDCLDGFSAPIAKDRVLNASGYASIAYLAVESANEPWPRNAKGISPGPFYLVWVNPEKSGIQREEWPFQLASFEVKGTLASSYPAILPDAKAPASVQRGFQLFVQNCFACHTMNRQGESELGPDLNVPMNVTESWKPAAIAAQVRDPQSVRYWPQGKMPSFPTEQLSDEDLKLLMDYLRHMAGRKVR
jgi:mono/diheme cytochrome c family protein